MRTVPGMASNRSSSDNMLALERQKLEGHARATLELLQQAKAANSRVMRLQAGSGRSFRSGSRSGRSNRPRTGQAGGADLTGLTGISAFGNSSPPKLAPLDLTKARGL
jgi:hypothetical protein